MTSPAEPIVVEIRSATPRDVVAIAALDRMSHRRPDSPRRWLSRVAKRSDWVVIVAERRPDAAIIGYGAMMLTTDTQVMSEVTVEESHRRRGVGRKIMQVLLRHPYGDSAVIQVSDLDVAGVEFLRSCGFALARDAHYIPGAVVFSRWRTA